MSHSVLMFSLVCAVSPHVLLYLGSICDPVNAQQTQLPGRHRKSVHTGELVVVGW